MADTEKRKLGQLISETKVDEAVEICNRATSLAVDFFLPEITFSPFPEQYGEPYFFQQSAKIHFLRQKVAALQEAVLKAKIAVTRYHRDITYLVDLEKSRLLSQNSEIKQKASIEDRKAAVNVRMQRDHNLLRRLSTAIDELELSNQYMQTRVDLLRAMESSLKSQQQNFRSMKARIELPKMGKYQDPDDLEQFGFKVADVTQVERPVQKAAQDPQIQTFLKEIEEFTELEDLIDSEPDPREAIEPEGPSDAERHTQRRKAREENVPQVPSQHTTQEQQQEQEPKKRTRDFEGGEGFEELLVVNDLDEDPVKDDDEDEMETPDWDEEEETDEDDPELETSAPVGESKSESKSESEQEPQGNQIKPLSHALSSSRGGEVSLESQVETQDASSDPATESPKGDSDEANSPASAPTPDTTHDLTDIESLLSSPSEVINVVASSDDLTGIIGAGDASRPEKDRTDLEEQEEITPSQEETADPEVKAKDSGRGRLTSNNAEEASETDLQSFIDSFGLDQDLSPSTDDPITEEEEEQEEESSNLPKGAISTMKDLRRDAGVTTTQPSSSEPEKEKARNTQEQEESLDPVTLILGMENEMNLVAAASSDDNADTEIDDSLGNSDEDGVDSNHGSDTEANKPDPSSQDTEIDDSLGNSDEDGVGPSGSDNGSSGFDDSDFDLSDIISSAIEESQVESEKKREEELKSQKTDRIKQQDEKEEVTLDPDALEKKLKKSKSKDKPPSEGAPVTGANGESSSSDIDFDDIMSTKVSIEKEDHRKEALPKKDQVKNAPPKRTPKNEEDVVDSDIDINAFLDL